MQARLIFILIALVLGAILPIQAAINTRLVKTVGTPVAAAFVSFAVGTLALLIYLLITRQFNWQGTMALQAPWWIWIGGLLGTFYVAGIVALLPSLGTVLTFSLVIAGQTIAAVIIDHFGWLNVAIREVSPGRIVGIILLIIGVVLVRRY
ncbi:MAG: DMT family transporter [Chitinophagales bacterium]